jgi:hypothetical protein
MPLAGGPVYLTIPGSMTIQFKKGKDKPSTLTVIRSDGTRTWTPLKPGFGPLHDLAHFVIETELGLAGGFYGLLNQEHDITDFEEDADRSWINDEGRYAEAVVMTLQYVYHSVAEASRFNEMVAETCGTLSVPSGPAFSDEKIGALCRRYKALVERWRQLPPGDILELTIVWDRITKKPAGPSAS